MTFDEYQKAAHTTSLNTKVGTCALTYPMLMLAGEAGEVAGKLAKIHRDNGGVVTGADQFAIAKELGDVLWGVAEIATRLELSLEGIAEMNIEKLADRQRRGVIGGSGDER
jgi:NTP pyrophosphatase (non-canonical NTP hydrolase)